MIRTHLLHGLVVLLLFLYPGIYSLVQSGAQESTVGVLLLLLPREALMFEILVLALFAISFDFISGYTGYLSFGHSLFFGTGVMMVLGARTNAFVEGGVPVLSFFGPGTPLMQVMLGAVVLSMLLALLVGGVSFRLTGVYFAMITLGVAELARFVVVGYISETGIQASGSELDWIIGLPGVGGVNMIPFRGSQVILNDVPLLGLLIGLLSGLPVVGPLVPARIQLTPLTSAYMAVGIVVVLSYFVMQRILNSPFGKVMIAIRENEERATAIGLNTYYYKNVAFAISAAFGAIAGVLQASWSHQSGAAEAFGVLERGGPALVATIIGGIGTLAGPFYGTLFDENLVEVFDRDIKPFLGNLLGTDTLASTEILGTPLSGVIDIWLTGHAQMYTGVVFIVFILFVPGGLLGTLRLYVGGKLSHRFGDVFVRLLSRGRSRIGR
jgi:branched-chain amino acid transport system permease protein